MGESKKLRLVTSSPTKFYQKMNAFEEHAVNAADYESMLDSGLARLTLNFARPQEIPCTHTMVDVDWILSGGKSPTTMVERCEFRSDLIPQALWPAVQKGLLVSLVVRSNTPPVALQLWNGGLMQGGTIFRFMLVDASFRG